MARQIVAAAMAGEGVSESQIRELAVAVLTEDRAGHLAVQVLTADGGERRLERALELAALVHMASAAKGRSAGR